MMFALETMAGTMQTAAEKKYAILWGMSVRSLSVL